MSKVVLENEVKDFSEGCVTPLTYELEPKDGRKLLEEVLKFFCKKIRCGYWKMNI